MRKVRMSKKSSSENSKIKQEIKEECKDYDPAVHARDRLKGALQDLQALHSDNSTDSDDYRVKSLSHRKKGELSDCSSDTKTNCTDSRSEVLLKDNYESKPERGADRQLSLLPLKSFYIVKVKNSITK